MKGTMETSRTNRSAARRVFRAALAGNLLALLLLAAPGASGVTTNLFVANTGNSIEQYNMPVSGAPTPTTFSSSGLLNYPVGLAFDTSGNLYVANNGNSTIVEYANAVSTEASVIIPSTAGLDGPEGIAFDSAGNLYVANDGGAILMFTPKSGGGWNTPGTSVASVGTDSPQGLAFDAGGNLYVANWAGGSGGYGWIEYFKFVSVGVFQSGVDFENSGQVLQGPIGLAFDGAGNLYVADPGYPTIVKYAAGVWNVDWTTCSGLSEPWGLAFDNSGILYDADAGNNPADIGTFNSSGVCGTFTSTGLSSPAFLAIWPIPSLGAPVTVPGNSWTNSVSGRWEMAANWSSGSAPSSSDTADLITNASSKTVTIDATTSGSYPATMTLNTLTILAPVGSINTLFLNWAGVITPLAVSANLAIGTNGALVANSSRVQVSGNLVVGQGGGNAALTITNSGAVYSGNGYVGATQSGCSNTVLVSGNGLWNMIGAPGNLYVGFEGGFSNQCAIGTNGLVVAAAVYIGYSDSVGSSTNNVIQVNDGELLVSPGALVVSQGGGPGAVTFNGGSISVGQLVLTNGANSLFTFNAGTLTSAGSFVTNSQVFYVGDGTHAAWFNLNGGVHNFYNNLEIRNNATLTGCGTINGNVTVDAGGTMLANCGTLTFNGMVANSGTVLTANGQDINFVGPVVNNTTGVINTTNGAVQFLDGVVNTGTILTNVHMETILRSFGSSPTDGVEPNRLVQGSDGNFYGTTDAGGTYGYGTEFGTYGYGTVFRISPSGAYTILHSFADSPNDGSYPSGIGLVRGSDGNFYGATQQGGANVGIYNGYGTVFRFNPSNPSGTYTILYSFGSQPNDGNYPSAAPVQGSDGNFYGTTFEGGTYGYGTVFRISPIGTYTILYSFAGPPNDGNGPEGALVQGSDGNFYGATLYGGASGVVGGASGWGTVFRFNPSNPSGSETILHSFAGPPTDGMYPGTLVQGSDGNFYGTTAGGGTSENGTVFRFNPSNPSGTYTFLHNFGDYPTDGVGPGGLVQGSDGNFYGTTGSGGTNSPQYGTVFRISPSGTYTSLYSFVGSPTDGVGPNGLFQGIDGYFYGTTGRGGSNNWGTVFRITIPLSQPPNQPGTFSITPGTGCSHTVNNTTAGAYYQLQYNTTLNPLTWQNVPGVAAIKSTGGPLTVTDPNCSGPQEFYRFAITP